MELGYNIFKVTSDSCVPIYRKSVDISSTKFSEARFIQSPIFSSIEFSAGCFFQSPTFFIARNSLRPVFSRYQLVWVFAGSRFAMYQVKMALIRVIKNFRILPINKTMDKVIEDKTSFLLTPVGGIHVKLKAIFS